MSHLLYMFALDCNTSSNFTAKKPDMISGMISVEDFALFQALGLEVKEQGLAMIERPSKPLDFCFDGLPLEMRGDSVSFPTAEESVEVYQDRIRFVGSIKDTDQTWYSEFLPFAELAERFEETLKDPSWQTTQGVSP